MGVGGVEPDHFGEVVHCILVQINHLIRFRPFVDVVYLLGKNLDTLCQGPNSFLELLLPAVSQSQVIVDVGLVLAEGVVV